MSAPDIGTLRAIIAVRDRAHSVMISIAAEIIAAEFGPGDGMWRTWEANGATVDVHFAGDQWQAAAYSGDGAGVYPKADTPRAAVDQALAALRLTHPAEADALAAVVPAVPRV